MRHPFPQRFCVTCDGRSMNLTWDSWALAREHVDYLHRCFPYEHIYGITSFTQKYRY